MHTVLVTGGTGFVGGWCVVELLRRGYGVRTTVRDRARETELRDAIASQVEPADRLTVLTADLGAEEGWAKAVAGCAYVLHVASPFPATQPKDAEELIAPARDGTRRVLGAALDAGVRRVVVTSSLAAVSGGDKLASEPLDEGDWSDPENPKLTPYARSKTAAERAAWDLARERGATERLAVVNPGAILGPTLHEDHSYSLDLVKRLLEGTPGIPKISFSLVDVRDVADLHIKAMTAAEAGGQRFIAAESTLWLADVAAVLRSELSSEAAANVPRRRVPNLAVRAMGLFDPSIRAIVGQLGKRNEVSSAKARDLLGWSSRPSTESILDCAHSLGAR